MNITVLTNWIIEILGIFNLLEVLLKSFQKPVPHIHFSKEIQIQIQIGQNYWIVGGGVNPNKWGSIGSQKSSIIWFSKKLKWVKGPKLPDAIFLFYASASAINSTHVIFVGANTNYDGEGLIKK